MCVCVQVSKSDFSCCSKERVGTLHPDAGGNVLAVMSINSANPEDSEDTDCLAIKGQYCIKPALNNRAPFVG